MRSLTLEVLDDSALELSRMKMTFKPAYLQVQFL